VIIAQRHYIATCLSDVSFDVAFVPLLFSYKQNLQPRQPFEIIKPYIGEACVPIFDTLFNEAVGWQHIVPYALMFVPLVSGPALPTPPPLPQQGMSISFHTYESPFTSILGINN
jgi:hypothetical protein